MLITLLSLLQMLWSGLVSVLDESAVLLCVVRQFEKLEFKLGSIDSIQNWFFR
jgi:hypothetical protein